MKKLAILSAMMFAVALWFGGTVSAGGVNPPEADVEDGCGDGCVASDWTDIDEVEAFSTGTNIIVNVDLCAGADEANTIDENTMIKYRVHIDHRLPEPVGDEDEQPYGADHVFVADGDCNNSDSGVMFRFHMKRHKSNTGQNPLKFGKVYGPGDVVVDDDLLTFTIPYDRLRNDLGEDPVGADNTVHIWVDTQNSRHEEGICDRAPNTNTDECDGGTKPDEASEVLTIKLD
jgi:hypothetical protein